MTDWTWVLLQHNFLKFWFPWQHQLMLSYPHTPSVLPETFLFPVFSIFDITATTLLLLHCPTLPACCQKHFCFLHSQFLTSPLPHCYCTTAALPVWNHLSAFGITQRKNSPYSGTFDVNSALKESICITVMYLWVWIFVSLTVPNKENWVVPLFRLFTSIWGPLLHL